MILFLVVFFELDNCVWGSEDFVCVVFWVVVGLVLFIVIFGMWNFDVNECYYGIVIVVVVEVVVKLIVFVVVGIFVVWGIVGGLKNIIVLIDVLLILIWE